MKIISLGEKGNSVLILLLLFHMEIDSSEGNGNEKMRLCNHIDSST